MPMLQLMLHRCCTLQDVATKAAGFHDLRLLPAASWLLLLLLCMLQLWLWMQVLMRVSWLVRLQHMTMRVSLGCL